MLAAIDLNLIGILATSAVLAIANFGGPALEWLRSLRSASSEPIPAGQPAWPSDKASPVEADRYIAAMHDIACSDSQFRRAVTIGQSPASFMRELLAAVEVPAPKAKGAAK